ncbi:MAG: DUF6751 family protein [Lachnospiraceae bacterium]
MISDITIYNRIYNKDTRLDDWQGTIICGVNFYVDNKISIGDNCVNSADICKIRIPEDAKCESQYVDKEEYVGGMVAVWTLANDDYVVIGKCDLHIDKPADLLKAHKRYFKITSWADNRFGGIPHLRIGGV